MNSEYVYKLLLKTEQQPQGCLQIRGKQADHAVRLMVEAGLVEASLSTGKDSSITTINSLTDLGREFVRSYKAEPSSAPTLPLSRSKVKRSESDACATVLEKWKINFALGLRRPKRTE